MVWYALSIKNYLVPHSYLHSGVCALSVSVVGENRLDLRPHGQDRSGQHVVGLSPQPDLASRRTHAGGLAVPSPEIGEPSHCFVCRLFYYVPLAVGTYQ